MKLFRTLSGLLACGVSLFAQANLPIETWNTSAGTKVLFVQAKAIPMLDINLDFDAGGRYAPADKVGLAGLTLEMLDKGIQHIAPDGATVALDEAQITDALADLGAQLTASPSLERISIQLRTLSNPAQRVQAVALFASVLQRPTFPATILTREQANRIASLREADTQPDSLLERHLAQRLYPNHPYGRRPTVATLQAIQLADIQAFYQAYYSAKRAVLSMIGDISRSQAEAIAEQLTQALPVGEAAPDLPPLSPNLIGTEILPHPASQAHIALAIPSLKRGDPDFFPLLVGNYVLGGGGFVSRLMSEVREKRGLAYSVQSYFQPQAIPGPFQISLQTKKEQAETALQVTRQTLEKFLQTGPTPKELQAAKQNLVNGFPLRIDSNRKLLDNLAMMGFYNLPLTYLDDWTTNIEKVKLADVHAAFQRKIDVNKLTTVVVGAAQ